LPLFVRKLQKAKGDAGNETAFTCRITLVGFHWTVSSARPTGGLSHLRFTSLKSLWHHTPSTPVVRHPKPRGFPLLVLPDCIRKASRILNENDFPYRLLRPIIMLTFCILICLEWGARLSYNYNTHRNRRRAFLSRSQWNQDE
jgi:hypothetical protein